MTLPRIFENKHCRRLKVHFISHSVSKQMDLSEPSYGSILRMLHILEWNGITLVSLTKDNETKWQSYHIRQQRDGICQRKNLRTFSSHFTVVHNGIVLPVCRFVGTSFGKSLLTQFQEDQRKSFNQVPIAFFKVTCKRTGTDMQWSMRINLNTQQICWSESQASDFRFGLRKVWC